MPWIDDWLPAWQFDEVHHIHSAAAPGGLLDAAAAYDPAHDRWITTALALREAPGRLAAVLGLQSLLGMPGAQDERRRFGLGDFVSLGREGDAALAYGLAGRFWEPGYGLQPLADAQAFVDFAAPGSAKLLLGFVAQREGSITRLTTLTRVACTDDDARRRLAVYWALIRPVSGLIRQRILTDIRSAAEGG